MAADEHAIVVGIQRSPMFGMTEDDANDLRAPDTDAAGIHDWLIDPAGGNVPPDNVKLIRSQDFPNAAEPQQAAITNAFDELDRIAGRNDRNGLGRRVGRRLYLYASGHGFAKRRTEGALFMANATRVRTWNVPTSAWSEWFANAAYFDEVVLWMDACMTSELSILLAPAGYGVNQAVSGGARMFSAFAARFPLMAVERKMPDGLQHGVFTYALLEGLRGRAADPDSLKITTDGLRGYLINAMKTFMSDQDQQDMSVSKEPDFGFVDQMEFGSVASAPTFPAAINFPPTAVGQPFIVQTGAPLTTVLSGTVTAASQVVNLPKGVYFARVEPLGWLQDFTIVGGDHVVGT